MPITHLDKIYFPKDKVTKKMVAEYYQKIASFILPYSKDGPESFKRNSNGIDEEGFFHKDEGDNAPDFIKSYAMYS